MFTKDIIVLYHGKCPDGFGAAYAAWKKFGDAADYAPVDHGDPPPEGLEGKEVYLVDFCYEIKEQTDSLIQTTKHFVVLDHHRSAKEFVESAPEHVYDAERSGASIAWAYFHPGTQIPKLIQYIEDGDLYKFALPETHDIFSYLVVLPYEFAKWDEFSTGLEDTERHAELLKQARAFTEFFEALAQLSVARAKKVLFEGYEVFFAATHPDITMKSFVGSELYKKQPPFALVVTAHPNGYGVSIRGDGSIDVSKIAEKYGGGGHAGSAGFFIPNGEHMPWKEAEEHEDSGN